MENLFFTTDLKPSIVQSATANWLSPETYIELTQTHGPFIALLITLFASLFIILLRHFPKIIEWAIENSKPQAKALAGDVVKLLRSIVATLHLPFRAPAFFLEVSYRLLQSVIKWLRPTAIALDKKKMNKPVSTSQSEQICLESRNERMPNIINMREDFLEFAIKSANPKLN